MDETKLIEITGDIIREYIKINQVAPHELPGLIQSVRASLYGPMTMPPRTDMPPAAQVPPPAAGQGRVEATTVTEPGPVPAVPVERSVFPEYIVCLEDGRHMRVLKRYIQRMFGMTEDDYRKKWNLPEDYPMVAPAYSLHRRFIAKMKGLGKSYRKAGTPAEQKAQKEREHAYRQRFLKMDGSGEIDYERWEREELGKDGSILERMKYRAHSPEYLDARDEEREQAEQESLATPADLFAQEQMLNDPAYLAFMEEKGLEPRDYYENYDELNEMLEYDVITVKEFENRLQPKAEFLTQAIPEDAVRPAARTADAAPVPAAPTSTSARRASISKRMAKKTGNRSRSLSD
ncbi:MucR family transcriptional regulator [Komagataeibacter rhaeticus]|uniref:MucR family transcriptional regulator n=1 Tax=Komagataeibacter rhaeticus TaxID=215221 RepID=UPI0039EC8BED